MRERIWSENPIESIHAVYRGEMDSSRGLVWKAKLIAATHSCCSVLLPHPSHIQGSPRAARAKAVTDRERHG